MNITDEERRIEFKLGQPVVARAVTVRVPDPDGELGAHWERSPLDEPAHGIVVGCRVKQAGRIVAESETDEFGYKHAKWNGWRRTGSFPVILVATDLRRNHLICPVDDVEAEHAEA